MQLVGVEPGTGDGGQARVAAELRALAPAHAGVLLACYSDHPLVGALRTGAQPVVGIMEASVYHALAQLRGPAARFAIVTTGRVWEALLADGVRALLGGDARLAAVAAQLMDAGACAGPV